MSDSFLCKISRSLKVPCLCVQTNIVIKAMEKRSHHSVQEGDGFCVAEMNVFGC